MRSKYVGDEEFFEICRHMSTENSLALRVSRETGLRIGDVLGIKTHQVRAKNTISVREKKTGKIQNVEIPNRLVNEMLKNASRVYVWRNRRSADRHRTRHAVYSDMKKACRLLNIPHERISPHSARKTFAVAMLKNTNSLKAVQKRLNHKYDSTTLIYALSDKLDENTLKSLEIV